MSLGAQGLIWCLTFVVLDAAQAVFFGGVFQRMDTFLIGLLVFGLSAMAAIGWTLLRAPDQVRRALNNRSALIGINLTAAAGWLTYLFAIQLIEPAVAFTIFTGAVPLTTIITSRFGVPEASPVRNRLEATGNVVLAIGIITLAALTLAGWSGFVRGGLPTAAAGILLAASAGSLMTWMLFYGRRLHHNGVRPVTQYGLRFPVFLVLSLAAFVGGIDARDAVPVGDIALAVAVGFLTLAFPVYAVQKAVSLVSPLTIGAFAAVSPLFVFGFQLIEGRVGYAPPTLVGLSICFLGAVIALIGSSRATGP